MLRDITLGQYYQTDSCIHRLDPRTKIIITLIYIVSIFIKNNPYVYGLALAFLIFCIALSRVPLKFIFKGMKAILIILLFTVFFNILFTDGNVIWQWGFLKVTKEGLISAGYMALRLTMLVIGSSLMTLTTTPTRLTDGIEKVLHPLSYIKVPVHEIAMMMSIALRFIPILMEETDKIMKAQMARGADFESGNIIKKMKSMVPILIPLFVSSFRRANDMAMAMEARCYRGESGRTKMKPLKYHKRDAVAYIVSIVYLIAIIFLIKYTTVVTTIDLDALAQSVKMS